MIIALFLIVALSVAEVAGHGRLMNPPARNSMWRDGFESEPNYSDNGLNCGGASVSLTFSLSGQIQQTPSWWYISYFF